MALKKLLLLCVIIVFAFNAKSQGPLGDDGNQFSLATGYNLSGIPVYLSYEMGLLDYLSFGLEGTYRTYAEKTDSANHSHNILGFNFFSNYYFNDLLGLDGDKWGVYAGLNLGYYKWFSPDDYFEVGKSSSTLAIGAQLGGRYYFKDWGIFMEFTGGTENAGGKIGASYRFY